MLDKKDSVLAHSILFHFWQVLKQLFKEEEISIHFPSVYIITNLYIAKWRGAEGNFRVGAMSMS